MNVNGRIIGSDHPPYLIAEMSNNHLRDLNKALAIIDAAVETGADAIKIQTYTPDSLTIDCDKPDFVIQDPLWRGQTYYQLYKKIAMPLDWTETIFSHARSRGLEIFSSPFDEAAVDLLEQYDCPAYKVASFEAQDYPLIRRIARTGKPMIISSGTSTLVQLEQTLTVARAAGATQIAVLHCISSYPAAVADMNLRALERLKCLDVIVGLSDHSISNLAATTAVGLGASIIEKHFTLDRADGGPDAEFSLQPAEFRQLVTDCRAVWESLGSATILDQNRRAGYQHARSLYAVKDIAVGEMLTEHNVRLIRPGFGLPPSVQDHVIGSCARTAITRGTALDWSMINTKPS